MRSFLGVNNSIVLICHVVSLFVQLIFFTANIFPVGILHSQISTLSLSLILPRITLLDAFVFLPSATLAPDLQSGLPASGSKIYDQNFVQASLAGHVNVIRDLARSASIFRFLAACPLTTLLFPALTIQVHFALSLSISPGLLFPGLLFSVFIVGYAW